MAHVTHFCLELVCYSDFCTHRTTCKIALYSALPRFGIVVTWRVCMSQTLNNLLTLLNLEKIEEGLFRGQSED
ncbi:hypothetical protein WX79_004551, partial [Salmonella enterica subsp. enterica serovar Carrau]|nr:hypothetical protein [Salmonella enterica subsp. enterica serovar Carrau]